MADRDDELEEDNAQPQEPAEFQQHHVVEALNELQEAKQDIDGDPAGPDPEALQAPPEIPAAPEVGPVELPPESQPSPVQDVAGLKDAGQAPVSGNLLAEMFEPPKQTAKPADEPAPAPRPSKAVPPQEKPTQPPDWVDAVKSMLSGLREGQRDLPPEDEEDEQPPNVGGIPVEAPDQQFPEFGGKDPAGDQQAALNDAAREATRANARLLGTMVEMLADHARQLNQLRERLEREL